MDANGFDHDDGMNAFTVEKNTVLRKRGTYVGGAPAYVMAQVHKDKDMFNIVVSHLSFATYNAVLALDLGECRNCCQLAGGLFPDADLCIWVATCQLNAVLARVLEECCNICQLAGGPFQIQTLRRGGSFCSSTMFEHAWKNAKWCIATGSFCWSVPWKNASHKKMSCIVGKSLCRSHGNSARIHRASCILHQIYEAPMAVTIAKRHKEQQIAWLWKLTA